MRNALRYPCSQRPKREKIKRSFQHWYGINVEKKISIRIWTWALCATKRRTNHYTIETATNAWHKIKRSSWPGFEPGSPASQAGVLNHYTISSFWGLEKALGFISNTFQSLILYFYKNANSLRQQTCAGLMHVVIWVKVKTFYWFVNS